MIDPGEGEAREGVHHDVIPDRRSDRRVSKRVSVSKPLQSCHQPLESKRLSGRDRHENHRHRHGSQSIAVAAIAASAQEKVVLGMSGWTGFAPLSLADKAGIFKKNGVDVEIRFIPPVQRSAALAAGALNAAATTVDQHIVWTSAGIPTVQVVLIDKSNGGDGIAVRGENRSIKDLKGKTVAVDGPGTVQHFMLSYILEKNGLSIRDVIRQTMGAQPAAQSFVTGQNDAAVTYEPYLSTVRAKPDAGKILVTTKEYPVVIDTLVFRKDFIEKSPEGREGGGRQLLRGARHDQARAAEGATRSWAAS